MRNFGDDFNIFNATFSVASVAHCRRAAPRAASAYHGIPGLLARFLKFSHFFPRSLTIISDIPLYAALLLFFGGRCFCAARWPSRSVVARALPTFHSGLSFVELHGMFRESDFSPYSSDDFFVVQLVHFRLRYVGRVGRAMVEKVVVGRFKILVLKSPHHHHKYFQKSNGNNKKLLVSACARFSLVCYLICAVNRHRRDALQMIELIIGTRTNQIDKRIRQVRRCDQSRNRDADGDNEVPGS